MSINDALKFKAWKRKTNYKPVNEGFLDDDEDKAPTDSLTVGDTVEDKPDEEDAAELTGFEETPEETDDAGESEESTKEQEKDGVTDSNADMLASIKDMLSNLNTSIQTMNDTIAKQAEKKEDSSADGDEFADLDLSDSDESDTDEDAGNDSGDDSDSDDDNDSGDNNNDAGDEGTEGSNDSSDNDGDNAEDNEESDSGDNDEDSKEDNKEAESDEEYSGDDEHDDRKSEAYNQNMKRGGILNSNSHTIVGILESGKYWKLDDGLDTLVHLKLREKIEKAKSAFRQHMLESVLDDED